jgi:aryl-alcohol dehydrogenase-like predicted oxidoreductase
MKYRTIGADPKIRREVSVLSLGTMHFDGRLLAAAEGRLCPPGQAGCRRVRPSGYAARLAALREVAEDAGATVNQVVLAWLIGAQVPVIPVIPLVGASSVAQLDESLAAVDLELTTDQRTRLDAAG